MSTTLRLSTLFLGFIVLWQMLVYLTHAPPYLLPGPFLVFRALMQDTTLIVRECLPTLIEMLSGFAIALICGMLFAIILSVFQGIRLWLLPVLLISQALPLFAFAPLFVIWLGYGMTSKIFTTTLMLFFPIASNFYDGLKNLPQDWQDLSQMIHASKMKKLFRIQIPAALPQLAGGIRIAAVGAPLGAVLGEWVGSNQGLGFLMLNANARLQVDLVFACVFVVILLSLMMYFGVDRILRKIIFWDKA